MLHYRRSKRESSFQLLHICISSVTCAFEAKSQHNWIWIVISSGTAGITMHMKWLSKALLMTQKDFPRQLSKAFKNNFESKNNYDLKKVRLRVNANIVGKSQEELQYRWGDMYIWKAALIYTFPSTPFFMICRLLDLDGKMLLPYCYYYYYVICPA